MNTEHSEHNMLAASGLSAGASTKHGMHINHHYRFECFEYEGGPLLWSEEFDNLVTTAGHNKYLDATLKTGLASPAWYIGLKNTGTVNAADTMASHSGWTTNTTYSNATNPAWTPGSIAAGSVDNSGSVAVFNINGSTTLYGAFLSDNSAVGGATGILLAAGDFGTAQPVISGNVLNCTITCTSS